MGSGRNTSEAPEPGSLLRSASIASTLHGDSAA